MMFKKNVFTLLGAFVALLVLVASVPVMVLGGILTYTFVFGVYSATVGWNAVFGLAPPPKPAFEPFTLCRVTVETIENLWAWMTN